MTDQNALSITELQQKAEMGDAQAQLELAYRFSEGEGIESNKEMALKWLTSAAESGNAEAQLALGSCLNFYLYASCDNNDSALHRLVRSTLIKNWDDNLSISWISKSAEQNNIEAQYSLYECFKNGIGVNKNKELALAWLTKSANNGYSQAHMDLAFYYSGKNDNKNKKLGFQWFEKAAEAGILEAYYMLACCYMYGNCVELNYFLAHEWLTKYINQVEKSDYDEDCRLQAEYFSESNGVQQHYDKACFLIAELYAEGKGIQQDYEKAIALYEELYERCEDNICKFNRALDTFTKYNPGKDNEFLETKISDLEKWINDIKLRIVPCYNEIEIYLDLTDKKKAYAWHSKAAEHGRAKSNLWLAKHYLNGDILEYLEEPMSQDSCYYEACCFAELARKIEWFLDEEVCIEANLICGFLNYLGLTQPLEARAEPLRFTLSGHAKDMGIDGFLSSSFIYSDNRLFLRA